MVDLSMHASAAVTLLIVRNMHGAAAAGLPPAPPPDPARTPRSLSPPAALQLYRDCLRLADYISTKVCGLGVGGVAAAAAAYAVKRPPTCRREDQWDATADPVAVPCRAVTGSYCATKCARPSRRTRTRPTPSASTSKRKRESRRWRAVGVAGGLASGVEQCWWQGTDIRTTVRTTWRLPAA